MSQSLAFLGFHLVGLAVCLAIGPRRRPWLCCALAFPLGLAVMVVAVLAMLIVKLPYNVWSVSAAATIVLIASSVAITTRGIDRRTLAVAGAWTAGFSLLCVPVTSVNLAVMTHDSHIFVMLGHVVANDGQLAPDMLAILDEWGVFQVVAQSMFVLTAQDYLYSLPLVLGLSFVPIFGITLCSGLSTMGVAPRYRALLAALVTVTLFTINMVGFHIFYLHTNMASAVFLFGFVALFWLAEVERDTSLVPIAMICAIALAFQRTETPLVALIFLALVVPRSELPRRAITPWLALFTLVVGVWYEVLAHHVSAESSFLTPARCRMVWGALLACFVWWLASPRITWIQRVNRILPVAIAALFALALVAAFATRTDHIATAARNWLQYLVAPPFWSQAWYAVGILIALAALTPPPRFREAFVIGIPVYFAFVLLLALSRSPYRFSVDDSANRMTMHIVPLVFFYLGLKLMPALGSRRTEATVGREQPRSRSALGWLTLVLAFLPISTAVYLGVREPAVAEHPDGPREAKLTRTIPFAGFRADEAYPADLDGDGRMEFLFLQSPGIYQAAVFESTKWKVSEEEMAIYCLTAVDDQGEKLWQFGTPWLGSLQYPSHVADQMVWSGDLANRGVEVVALRRDGLYVLDPTTGEVRRSTKLDADNYTIVHPIRAGSGTRLLIKNTERHYGDHWYGDPAHIYDADLNRIATMPKSVGSGHSPRPVDLDGDGDEEILVGYEAYDLDGKRLWRLEGQEVDGYDAFGTHVDQLQAGPIGPNGETRIVYAGSSPALLGTPDGRLTWKRDFGHPQHVVLGRFRKGDREARIALFSVKTGEAQKTFARRSGRKLSKKKLLNIAWLGNDGAIVSLVFPKTAWPASPDRKSATHSGEGILVYPQGCPDGSDAVVTRDWGWPQALGMSGEPCFVLPFPGQGSSGEDNPVGPNGYGIRIADFDGDGRVDVLVHDRTTAWIFEPPMPSAKTPGTQAKLKPVTGQGSYTF